MVLQEVSEVTTIPEALVNTGIGMGTVFIVLILISFIIYLLKFVPRLLSGSKDKKKEAEHNIKGMLVIDEICRKENIIVDSKALNDKYAELAKLYNMKVEDIKKALEPNKNEVLRNLRNELFTKFILENNKD